MNLSKKHLKHLQNLRDRVTDDVCYKCGCYDSIKVKWEKGSTSDTDIWFCNLEDIEVVKYSETQINTSWIEKLGYGGWGDVYWLCGSCHKEWFFKEGTPLQNDWHFCPKCGTKKANEIRIGENLEDESK